MGDLLKFLISCGVNYDKCFGRGISEEPYLTIEDFVTSDNYSIEYFIFYFKINSETTKILREMVVHPDKIRKKEMKDFFIQLLPKKPQTLEEIATFAVAKNHSKKQVEDENIPRFLKQKLLDHYKNIYIPTSLEMAKNLLNDILQYQSKNLFNKEIFL